MKQAWKLFAQAREILIECKILIQRSMSYVSIINSGMILFLMLSQLQEYGVNIPLTRWFFPLFFASVAAMLVVGFLDTRLGFFRTEHRRNTQRNPYFEEIIRRLDRIEKQRRKR